MKFKIKVKDTDEREWWEDYDKNVSDPHKWAKETLDHFNATLRSHETERELLEVVIENDSNKGYHTWVKSVTGMSVVFRGEVVDIMYCDGCGITGKRTGLRSDVKIDSKFRKKVYRECHTSRIKQGRV